MSLGSLAAGLVIARAVGVFGLRLRVVAWNNVFVGSMVFFLAIYEDYENSESHMGNCSFNGFGLNAGFVLSDRR